MGKSRRFNNWIANALLVVGLAAIWIAFAPVKLGGQVSYVLVNGISMEPRFHGGDLVLVRRSSTYQVADIVTYRDGEMGANVIHRIIGIKEDRFILKGDNNSWIDSYEPTSDEILGKMWIHLPEWGAAVEWIRSPIHLALVTGLLAGILILSLTMQNSNRKQNKKNQPVRDHTTSALEMALYLFGAMVLIFAALSIFAFTRPVMRPANNIQLGHTGVFNYSASGAPGVYDSDSIRPGEPVFTKLTCALSLEFYYLLAGERLENVSGSQQLYAMVMDEQSGWKRTIPLAADTSFSGNAHTSTALLDLCEVRNLVASVEQQTGLRINNYALVVAAPVTVSGSVAGQAFKDTFEPRLTFRFDSLHFYVTKDASQTNPLQTIQTRSLANPNMVQNTVKLFKSNPTVWQIRIIAFLGLVFSFGCLLVLGLFFFVMVKNNEEALIRIKYGSLLIDVHDHGLGTHPPVVDVAAIDDLANLAERQHIMIMHAAHPHADYYFVQIEGTTYRYVAPKRRGRNPFLDWFE